MTKKYHIVEPLKSEGFDEQWVECVQQIEELKSDNWVLFKLTVFVSIVSDAEYLAVLQSVTESVKSKFGQSCPTLAVIAQSPLAPKLLQVEAGYANLNYFQIEYRQYYNKPYVVLSKNGYREIWASGRGSLHDTSAIDQSARNAFTEIKQLLDSESVTFNSIVRQWNYIGQILSFKDINGRNYQNYQLFNEVRSDFYGKYRTVKGYPAATGIGAQAGGVVIDICAVDAAGTNNIVAIDNPIQCLPYQYSQSLLEGDVIAGKACKQGPQFERAKLVSNNHSGTLYVSGTAAIVGEQTIGINDIEQQTSTTIHHINQLISIENLIFHQVSLSNPILKESNIRVYIRHISDFSKVQAICNKAFCSHLISYIQADVCRENLLVEIEAEYCLETAL